MLRKSDTINKALFLLLGISLLFIFLNPGEVNADSVSYFSWRLSRANENTTAQHTITYLSPSGVSAGQTITLTIPSFTFGGGYTHTDMVLSSGNSNNCDTATYTTKSIGASPSGTTWGATYSSNVITFTSGTDTIAADRCIRVVLNTTTNTITNPTVSSNTVYTMTLSSGNTTDSGQSATIILDDLGTPDGDQVRINATVVPTLSMDLDTSTTNCNNNTENAAPYTVNLGSLSPGVPKYSDSTINFVCIDFASNASNGARILVRSSRNNAAGGLVSGGNVISSLTANLNLGGNPEGYGVRLSSTGAPSIGSFTAQSPYNSGTSGSVGALNGALGSATTLVNATAKVSTATSSRLAVEVGAKADTSTASGIYTDTIVFTAFSNF